MPEHPSLPSRPHSFLPPKPQPQTSLLSALSAPSCAENVDLPIQSSTAHGSSAVRSGSGSGTAGGSAVGNGAPLSGGVMLGLQKDDTVRGDTLLLPEIVTMREATHSPRRTPPRDVSSLHRSIDTTFNAKRRKLSSDKTILPSSYPPLHSEPDTPSTVNKPSIPPSTVSPNIAASTPDVSTLPLPLPSKRFRKTPGPKAVLIPVEQLPVYPLPTPPPILDRVILETVFNHQCLFPRSKGRFEEPVMMRKEGGSHGTESVLGEVSEAGHYEKLEHVGDSLLGMIVTTWLHEDKPRLTCGTATKLKAHLVSNATLSHLSGLYGFPQRLRGTPDQLPVLRAQTDVRAALMEAYIAGVYFSYPPRERFTVALGVLDKWLREMYEPLYEFFYNHMRDEYNQHHLSVTHVTSLPNGSTSTSTTLLTQEEISAIDDASHGMANLLRTYCQRNSKEFRFEEERYETHCGILWGIKCYVQDKLVGEATRSGRRAAKNVAAWEGCRTFGLIDADPPGVTNGTEDSNAAGLAPTEQVSEEPRPVTAAQSVYSDDKRKAQS